jgi:hypothetical protein
MKRAILVSLILISLLISISGIFYHVRMVKAVSVQINVKDLPEHKLILIGPSDPSFNGQVSAFLKGNHNAMVEATKPFSVFLKNTGNKAIVAYWLKWEKIRADGTIVTSGMGGSNPTALMEGREPGLEHLVTSSGYVIKPGSMHFVSPIISINEEQSGGIGAITVSAENSSELDKLQKAAENNNIDPMLDLVSEELKSCTSITISIDGVFFEDGTFVGPNTTNFFEGVQGIVDAKRDLLQEIAFAIEHKQTPEEIFSMIEQLTNSQNTYTSTNATSTNHYNFYKKMYAKEVLQMRKVLGDSKAIASALQPLRRQWRVLKKKNQ